MDEPYRSIPRPDGRAVSRPATRSAAIHHAEGSEVRAKHDTKRRTLKTGERRDYLAADSLQSYITRLYAKAGIKGGSSHSGRRTFATRMYAKTKDTDTVQLLLGHDSCDVSMRYIECDPRILRQAFADVI